jgi:hypothetical protein
MPAISGVTPTAGCRPGDDCLPGNPYQAGAWAATDAPMQPPPKAVIVPECADWCVINWEAMAPWDVVDQSMCIGRCLLENYVPANKVIEWGFLPTPMAAKPKCVNMTDAATCGKADYCTWGKSATINPDGSAGPPGPVAVNHCMDKVCQWTSSLGDQPSCTAAGCTWYDDPTLPPGQCLNINPTR